MLDKAPNGKVSNLLNALDKALSAGEVERAVDVEQQAPPPRGAHAARRRTSLASMSWKRILQASKLDM